MGVIFCAIFVMYARKNAMTKNFSFTTKVITGDQFWSEFEKRTKTDMNIYPNWDNLGDVVRPIDNTELAITMTNIEYKLDHIFDEFFHEAEDEAVKNESGKLKFKLKSVLIIQIFASKPEVKRAYDENVPLQIAENKFWQDYLQYEYKRYKNRLQGNQTTASTDSQQKWVI